MTTTLRLLLPRATRDQSIIVNTTTSTIPPSISSNRRVVPFSIPTEWLVELFVFNGTLYFETTEEQTAYCHLLGVCLKPRSAIEEDAFQKDANHSMGYKHPSNFVCFLIFIVNINRLLGNTQSEIISTQDLVITHVNQTAKLSCIIKNRNQRHVTWSRIHLINETQKLTYFLYIDLLKYTSLSRYHLTCIVDQDNKEYWNLEIYQVHLSDQGYYSCVLAAVRPISKLFHLRVIGSTFDMQREQMISSLSLIDRSVSTNLLIIILLFTI
ncbi:unnamed protein product [Rotaria magnacalcarata]|uniref:Immunoglobulin domain-containing protein n=2 Tax=Rotaria magnacalcarata TaxID=392030 RepID=A0A816PXD1_9BILA|nr:unnamed protein product [Rotaria magnacalcarata]CAF1676638.1 unnamed protein product [Rotaria magnacalcarata]CAF2053431.1 unnamed protein product [Rotaria magnacalcarata]CAF3920753.1 unnamed protein product [Rotaria magnacalcarata]CAF4091325.1 unnamed protein product [Rotaria magnacalcarata]